MKIRDFSNSKSSKSSGNNSGTVQRGLYDMYLEEQKLLGVVDGLQQSIEELQKKYNRLVTTMEEKRIELSSVEDKIYFLDEQFEEYFADWEKLCNGHNYQYGIKEGGKIGVHSYYD